jgi:hypothetical protein
VKVSKEWCLQECDIMHKGADLTSHRFKKLKPHQISSGALFISKSSHPNIFMHFIGFKKMTFQMP